MKQFQQDQKKEYKNAKERMKTVGACLLFSNAQQCSNIQEAKQQLAMGASKRALEQQQTVQKQRLQQEQAEAERRLADEHRSQMETELRALRRIRLIDYHALEQQLLRDVS